MSATPWRSMYQHTPAASKNNAFCWDDGTPSIFVASRDRSLLANKNGETPSQVASRAAQQYEDATGRSRGTVYGISQASDASSEEHSARVRAQRRPRRASSRVD